MIKAVYAATEDLSTIYAPADALGGTAATFGSFISPLIQNALILTALTAFIAVVIAGFNFVSSQGDKAKVQQATNMLNYALLGLVLAASAYVITQIVGRIGGIDNIFAPGI